MVFCLLSSPATAREPFDHSLWNQFIQTYVDESGAVDYQSLNKDPQLLEDYLQKIGSIDMFEFNSGSWPREEKLALWLNAFNAGVVDILRRQYPVENIQKIPGVWDIAAIQVAQKKYSLNFMRSNFLIGQFRDEKIHTALACGAVSCPPLYKEAFTGPEVEGQLFLVAQNYVNNPEFVVVEPGQKKVLLSRMFKWHGEDFKLDFGVFQQEKRKFTDIENAVLSFIAHYITNSDKLIYLEDRNYKIKYMSFDWSLKEWQSDAA